MIGTNLSLMMCPMTCPLCGCGFLPGMYLVFVLSRTAYCSGPFLPLLSTIVFIGLLTRRMFSGTFVIIPPLYSPAFHIMDYI
jgi:hypothetical protein